MMGHINQGWLSGSTPLQLALGNVSRWLVPWNTQVFWISINKGVPHFLGLILAFSRFGASLSMLHLRRHYVWHQSLFFASLITGFKLAPTGFLHRQQVSIPDSDKFSIDHSFFCNACCSCLGRIGNCLVIEKMDISTFRFRVFSMFLLVLDAFLER